MRQDPKPAIQCLGVDLSYGDRFILRDLDLVVPTGQHTAIMGPSGSGKTTLLHVLAGILDPDAGTVNVAGLELTKTSRHRRAKHRQHKVAMVFQFGELLPELTVGENVALPLRMRGQRPADGEVQDSLAAVGLSDVAAWPSQLSGGETQRVAVARALLTRPQVVLCDEPTGALDATNSQHVIELLRGAARQTGATMIVATHDHSVAEAMDDILVLSEARLTSIGTR